MSVRDRSVGSAVRNSHSRRGGARVARLAHLARLVPVGALVLAITLVAAACAGAAPSASPVATPPPTLTPTPNPHLAEPASIDAVFTWLNSRGLRVIGNNADRGTTGEPLKRINATYAGWPLILSEYSTAAAARAATGVARSASEAKATANQPAFTFVGLNVVADFGPRLRRDNDPAPDARFVQAATALAAALDPLLGPLGVRAIVHVPLPVAPSPSPTAASPRPSGSPGASSKPGPKATPKPSAKPKTTARPTVTPKPSG